VSKSKVIRGKLVLKESSLVESLTNRILSINATTGEVTDRPAIDTSALITTTLADGKLWIGNVSNVATAITLTGDVTVTNAGVTAIGTGVIVNADVNASAAIAYSKLNLTGSIVNADINAAAAIVYSKLNLTGGIVNADVAVAAAIARTKLADGTAYRILVNDSNGQITDNIALTASRAVVSTSSGLATSTTTNTQIGYLDTLTGNVQTQLDTEIASRPVNALVTTPTVAQDGFAIMWDDGTGEYILADPSTTGVPTGGTTRQVLGKLSATNYDTDWLDLLTSDITDITASADDLNVTTGVSSAGLTPTELTYLIGTTDYVQTQLDDKLSTYLPQNSIFVGDVSNVATALPTGADGFVFTSVGGVPQWVAASYNSGHTIQEEGVAVGIARTNLNFVGADVTVTDDAINDATVVTIGDVGYLDDIIDVNLSALADGDVLTYDLGTNEWINAPIAATIDGSGTTNELTYWVDSDTLGALAVATYPSLTEVSYVKGVTSAIQTQLDSKWSLASGGTLTGANTITGTGQTLKGVWDSLGTTSTEGYGLFLENTTAATLGNQQISPSITWGGYGNGSTTINASQSVRFMADVLPVQASTNPRAIWRLRASINGAAYSTTFVPLGIDSSGRFLFNQQSVNTSYTFNLKSISNSSSTYHSVWFNSSSAVLFTCTDTGVFNFGNGNGEWFSVSAVTNVANSNNVTTGANAKIININNTLNNALANGEEGTVVSTASMIHTSNTYGILGIRGNFSVSSGTGNGIGVHIRPSINTSGSYSGIYYCLDIDPNLGTTTGLTNIALRATSGSVLIGHTTLGASTTRTQIRGIDDTTGKILLLENLSGTEKFSVNGYGGLNLVTATTGVNKITYDALGVTRVDGAGLWLANTTAAAAGAQQYSPSIVLEGQGWKTNATAASQSVKFKIDVSTTQGTTAPSGTLRIASIVNNTGGDIEIFSMANTGVTNFFGTGLILSSSRTINWIAAGASGLSLSNTLSHTATAGTYYNVGITTGGLAVASGTTTFAFLNLTPTFNTTGTYSGIAYGIDYNPTLTSTTGLTHIAYRATSGSILIGHTTLGASTTRLQLRGISTAAGYNLLLEDSTGTEKVTIEDSGKTHVVYQGNDIEGFSYGTKAGTRISLVINGTSTLTGIAGYSGASTQQWYLGKADSATGFWKVGTGMTSGVIIRNDSGDTNATIVLRLQTGSVADNLQPTTTSVRRVLYSTTGFQFGVNSADTRWLNVLGTVTNASYTSVNGTYIDLRPTINTTGGSTTLRAFYYNPTLTSLTGLTHYAWESTAGAVHIADSARSSNWLSILKTTAGAHTALTAATEFVSQDFVGNTWTWADGTVTTQRFNYFRGYTLNKTTTSATFTDAYNVYIDDLTAGAGVTLTNQWSLGLAGNLKVSGSRINIANIPTSSAGLATGDIWNNGGILTIV